MAYASDILKKTENVADKKFNISEFGKGNIEAVAIGGIAGVSYAYLRQKSLIVYLVAGMIVGGLISNALKK